MYSIAIANVHILIIHDMYIQKSSELKQKRKNITLKNYSGADGSQ